MRMQGYCDVYKWTILKRTSPEVKCLHPTSSRREMCTPSVSNVIYHKFSHGAAFYTPYGKNVNVMLEFFISLANKGQLNSRKKYMEKHGVAPIHLNSLTTKKLRRKFHLQIFKKCLVQAVFENLKSREQIV